MDTPNIHLEGGEEVLLESGGATLTNKRLVIWRRGSKNSDAPQEVPIRDISSFKKANGGEESRLSLGAGAVAFGVAILLIEAMIPQLQDTLELVVFLVGSLSAAGGLYISVRSLLRIKPRTIVQFLVPGGDDVYVVLSGHDSPEADDLTRRFARVKRGL